MTTHKNSHRPGAQIINDHPAYSNDPNPRPIGWTGMCWLLFVCVTTFLLTLPFMRSIFWLGDEGILLHGAERLLQGRRLYIDFFEILPPGGFAIMALWFSITGISIWSARLFAILVITAIACFTFLACRAVSKHAPSSAFLAIGWAVMSQGFWTQINYHWFTTLLCMVAAWATLASIEEAQRRYWGPLIAGLAAGAAAMVVPTRGALAMLAAATGFVPSRCQMAKLIAFGLASSLVPTCLLVYVIAQGALAAAFDDVILFTATRYTSVASVPFAYLPDDQTRPLKYLFPLVALLTLITFALNWRRSIHDRLLRTCVAFGFAGFIGCFPRPDMAHLVFATPLVFPLLAYCTYLIVLSWPAKYRCALWPARYRYALVVLVITLGIHSISEFLHYAYTAHQGQLVGTPRGRVAILNDGARKLMARIAATPSSDRYFFYPYIPMLPFLTAREHVSRYDIFIPNYTTFHQYQEACTSALRHASWLVIDRNWTATTLLEYFPALRDADPPEKKLFELALQRGFEFAARDGAFELRRRVKTVDEAVCMSIAE